MALYWLSQSDVRIIAHLPLQMPACRLFANIAAAAISRLLVLLFVVCHIGP